MTIYNLAFYHFCPLTEERMEQLKSEFEQLTTQEELKGSLLIAPEGLNGMIAGTASGVEMFRLKLNETKEFQGIEIKVSQSESHPFSRMRIRLKQHLIPINADFNASEDHAPYIESEELDRWYEEGKDFLILDTRNDYEFYHGKFKNAQTLPLHHFRHFPEEVDKLPPEWRDKPVVTYCTGGIRCEKAAPVMKKMGFKNVYQLRDGILKYFEKTGGKNWDGDCFVFDQRALLDKKLQPIGASFCFGCGEVLRPEDSQCRLCSTPRGERKLKEQSA